MSNTINIERRSLQIRAAEGDEFALVGRALSYGEISSNELAPGFRERIVAGCFRDSLASGTDVKALWNHDSNTLPLGRLANKTLQLSDSPAGLDIRVQLDRNNSVHRDVYAATKRMDISEMSFAFVCEEQDFSDETYQGAECQVRNVRKARLLDVSVVQNPFYGDGATSVDARNTEAIQTAALRARLAAIDSTYFLRSKAHELGMKILADLLPTQEQRGSQDFLAARATQALASLDKPLQYCCHDADSIYGVDDSDDSDDTTCTRFDYSLDDDGNLELDPDSAESCSHHVISHAARAARSQKRADAELRRKMDIAAGRTVCRKN
jgi:hypothetical protein